VIDKSTRVAYYNLLLYHVAKLTSYGKVPLQLLYDIDVASFRSLSRMTIASLLVTFCHHHEGTPTCEAVD
jgi:hypothetical protein